MRLDTCPNVSLAGRNTRAHGLEIDCAIPVLCSNRCRRSCEQQRRAERERVKCSPHVDPPFRFLTFAGLLQEIPVILVFLHRFDVDESKGFPSRRLTKLGREIAVLDHEEPSGSCSFDPKKDVHRHLIRTLGKQVPAHVPWRRMHGLDANGFRSTRALEQACRASRNWRPRTPLQIRVVAVRSSRDAFPCLLRCRDTFVSSSSCRLRCRALRGPTERIRNSESFGSCALAFESRRIPLLRWSCCGGRGSCWFLTRSSLVASLMAAVASLMAMGAAPLPPLHPVCSGGLSGRGGGPAASCASASNGSKRADSVKPNAAPSPSREIAFRREIISVLIFSFTCCLPLTHDCRTGMASVERDHLNVGRRKLVKSTAEAQLASEVCS